jgi:hypothetical protein
VDPACVNFYTRVLNSPNVNTKGNPVLESGNLSNISALRTRSIYLPPGNGDWYDAIGLVGEIFHLAGKKAPYYDRELAIAVHNIPDFAARFSQNPNRNIFVPRWQGPSPKDK